MADTSRARLSYLAETVWGSTPAAALSILRYTGESLGYDIASTTSQEIRADRQIADLIQRSASASGGFNFELSYGAVDPLLAAALFSAWEAPVLINVVDDIEASAGNSNFTSSVTDFVASGVKVGQWLKASSFVANAGANNRYYRVTEVTENVLGVTPAPAVDEAAPGHSATFRGAMLRNGVTETSFTLEKHFQDVGKFLSFTGMVPGQFSLDIQTGSILRGSFGFVGKAASIGDASVGTGAPVDPAAHDVMNAANNVGEIREAGAPLASGVLQSLSIRLNNTLRPIQAVGALGNVDIGAGRCAVTGSVSVYFTDGALYRKYLDNTPTDLSFRVGDAAGNAYVVTLPRVRLTRGSIVAGGADQDVVASFDYQAVRDPGTGCTLQIDRFAA